MSNMMRGKTYDCGCCHSKGRGKNPGRDNDKRYTLREIEGELDLSQEEREQPWN